MSQPSSVPGGGHGAPAPAEAPVDSDGPARINAAIDAALVAHRGEPGALIPILHAVQDALGYLPGETAPRVAHELNLSRADVDGVISFYHDFRDHPPGRHVVKVCRAEACQAMGCESLVERLATRHGAPLHSTTDDGAVTVEPVYCLGNCALSPAVMVDGQLVGRVSAERLDGLMAGLRGRGAPKERS